MTDNWISNTETIKISQPQICAEDPNLLQFCGEFLQKNMAGLIGSLPSDSWQIIPLSHPTRLIAKANSGAILIIDEQLTFSLSRITSHKTGLKILNQLANQSKKDIK